ncbi:cytochrome b561 [Agrobacterium fabrum]|uniref:cytochrome b n=1 Tax=Agrobacterium fabrum TaxID=1176649 RepID=UPI0008815058|nr:cytochrome b [Agrobacterium fabrum]MDH6297065.1 cytochrome b561 [Agrobacterium fabrum]SDB65847.1 cytochrome b561 [Agrobacterium fabrum]SER41235.1 cytochrome b561 [Agrobacterium fabrum]
MASFSQVSFSIPQRAIHWAMALLIFFNLLFPDAMAHAYRLMRRGETLTPDQISSANIHAYVGFAILFLAVLRLCLRVFQGVPPHPAEEPRPFQIAAKVAHFIFYALFFVLPLSGIAAYYFGIQTAGQLHSGPFKVLMWVLIAGHVAAVLVHQFYWRTNILKRMTHG